MNVLWNALPETAFATIVRLAEASVIGGLFAAAAWALCRWVPRLTPAARAWIWWLVSLKFALVLAGIPALELPVLPRAVDEILRPADRQGATRVAPSLAKPVGGEIPVIFAAPDPSVATSTDPAEAGRTFAWRESWPVGLLLLWLAGVVAGGLAAARRVAAAHRLRRDARPEEDVRVLRVFESMRRRIPTQDVELRRLPGGGTPHVSGLRHPVILLPSASVRQMSDEELSLALGHELLHVRRRDLWLGIVPALAERLLFFHPLARLAAREYAATREAACDAAVLSLLEPSPRDYGRLLLKLGATACPPTASAPLVNGNALKRRIEMLHRTTHAPAPRRTWLPVAIAAMALTPLQLVAVADRPGSLSGVGAAAAGQALAPAAAPSPGAEDDARAFAFVLLRGDEVTMHGSSADVDRARAARQGAEDLLYARVNGEPWLVRDPEILSQVNAAMEPQRELGRQQAALGKRQADLGGQQAALGRQQAVLGARQDSLGAEQQAKIGAEMAELGAEIAGTNVERASLSLADSDDAGVAQRMSELERRERELQSRMRELSARQGELGSRQRRLGDEQRALGEQQRALGERQRPLGEQQRRLGEQQRRLAEQAEATIRELVDHAIADGRAQRISD